MKATVLGCGGWGMALALVLHSNGVSVTTWTHTYASCYLLQHTRCNTRLLPNVYLPAGIRITSDIKQAVEDSELVVMAVPSYAVEETAKLVAPHLSPRAIVVNVAKGIDSNNGYCTLSKTIRRVLGGEHPIVALTGPTHAEEVADSMPTAILAASTNRSAAEFCQDTFMNECFRVYTSPDIIGAELGGAFKNIIALGVGIADGMNVGDNARAAFMTRGLTEIARLGVALGAKQSTFAGLSGIGDLIVTCTSIHSRNYRAGLLIGKGREATAAIKEIGATVEGYYATKGGYNLAKQHRISMPITQAMYNVLYEGGSASENITTLMIRAKRHETEDLWLS